MAQDVDQLWNELTQKKPTVDTDSLWDELSAKQAAEPAIPEWMKAEDSQGTPDPGVATYIEALQANEGAQMANLGLHAADAVGALAQGPINTVIGGAQGILAGLDVGSRAAEKAGIGQRTLPLADAIEKLEAVKGGIASQLRTGEGGLASDVTGALGQIATLFTPGGAAQKASGFGLMSGAQGYMEADVARRQNPDKVSQEDVDNAFLANVPVGMLDVFVTGAGKGASLLTKAMPRVNEAVSKVMLEANKKSGGRLFRSMIASFLEGGEEAVQGAAQNYIAREFYDEGREILSGVVDEAAPASIAAGILGLLLPKSKFGKGPEAPSPSEDAPGPTSSSPITGEGEPTPAVESGQGQTDDPIYDAAVEREILAGKTPEEANRIALRESSAAFEAKENERLRAEGVLFPEAVGEVAVEPEGEQAAGEVEVRLPEPGDRPDDPAFEDPDFVRIYDEELQKGDGHDPAFDRASARMETEVLPERDVEQAKAEGQLFPEADDTLPDPETGGVLNTFKEEDGTVRTERVRDSEPEVEPEPQPVFSFPGGLLKLPGVKDVAKAAKRELTSQGDLPGPVFKRKVKKDSAIGAILQDSTFKARDLKRALKRESFSDTEVLDAALRGDQEAIAKLPEQTRDAIGAMRTHIDALSKRMVDEGVVQGDLATVIDENGGSYLNRSYQVFDDPKYADKVPKDVFNRAVSLIRSEGKEGDAEAYVRSLLDKASQSDGFLGMIQGGKIGTKDLSILKKRKDISPEIRALLGEYTDPLVNYTRSVQKMAHLIESHGFLTEVKEAGLAQGFFSEKASGENIRKIAADQSDVMRPLNGLYTTPEIEQAFRKDFEGSADNPWLRAWMKANGMTKYGKTILSPMTHVRNTVGNLGFAVANGHWRAAKSKDAWKAVSAKLGLSDSEANREYVLRLQRLGVLGDNVRSGELQDVLKDAMRQDPEEYLVSGPKRVLRKAAKAAEVSYDLEDAVWKVFAFENEMSRYGKTGLSGVELEQKAAEIVRNTYPTYSLVPAGVKKSRRFPFLGTFVSFPAEVFRVGKNTLALAARELRSSNPKVKAIGAERAVGILTAASASTIAAATTRWIQGISGEDDENARVFMPPWSQNSEILWFGHSPEGKRTWVDISYTDPWSYLKEPAMAMLRADSVDDAMGDVLRSALEPFLSEEIFTQSALDVARNKRSTGGEIYNPADPANEQAKDITAHMWKAVEPGAITQMRRIYRGMTGYVSPYGKSYDAGKEALAVFSGQRINELDPEQGLGFLGRDQKQGYADASRMVSETARRRGEVSDEELLESYRSAESVRQARFKDLHKAFKAAIALGLSPEEAMRALEGSVAKKYIRDLERGVYRPYTPSGSFLGAYLRGTGSETQAEYRRRKQVLVDYARELRPIPVEEL